MSKFEQYLEAAKSKDTIDRNFECPKCGTETTRKGIWKKTPRPFKCPKCGAKITKDNEIDPMDFDSYPGQPDSGGFGTKIYGKGY